MQLKTASGLILWLMTRAGFDGWTSLWGAVYVRPGYEGDARLIRHEQEHLNQMARDGKVWFMVRYAWWTLLYGYFLNPYEIEARAAAHHTPTHNTGGPT